MSITRSLWVALAIAVPSLSSAPTVAASEPDSDAVLRESFIDEAARSTDLRTRIAGTLWIASHGDGATSTSGPVSAAVLADLARGSTDPLVLSLMILRCRRVSNGKPSCDAVDFARRWTVADSQNQLAWIALSGQLRERGDVEGARAAFRRAAGASTWREQAPGMARLLATVRPGEPSARVRLAVLDWAFAQAYSAPTTLDALGTLHRSCNEPSLRAACVRIVETMWRDGETGLSVNSATRVARNLGLPEWQWGPQRRRIDAIYWAVGQTSPPDVPRDDEIPAKIAALEAVLRFGELGAGQRALERTGVPEEEAARRWTAFIDARQRESASKPIRESSER